MSPFSSRRHSLFGPDVWTKTKKELFTETCHVNWIISKSNDQTFYSHRYGMKVPNDTSEVLYFLSPNLLYCFWFFPPLYVLLTFSRHNGDCGIQAMGV